MNTDVSAGGSLATIAELKARLHEAEETLEAIRNGEVDALLIADGPGEKVYTLRGADAPYRALVEQMQEGAVTLSLAGDIVYSNQSFADLVGAPLERVIGSSMSEFVVGEDLAILRVLLVEGSGAMRTRVRTENGGAVDVHISVSHVQIDDVDHQTLIVSDLSTLTRIQRESQSKDEFLAMLAHELRNPLAPIRTGLQVLKLSPAGETAERAREMMERQLSQMTRLIDDLLDVSRVSRGKIQLKKEPIDLKTVIDLAVETSVPLIEAGGHELIVHLPSESLPIQADPTRLAQVFSNLLNNSAKYTPDGGRIELSAKRIQGSVEIQVRDNGVGIPKDMMPEVFEMFSQVGRNLDRAQGGLGIGLTLVRRLTEMHGGSVKVQSLGSGGGSVFTVTIPLSHQSPPTDAAGTEPSLEPPEKKKLRVLVVDDNVDGAQMLSMLIRIHGHATQIANSGPDALTQFGAFRAQLVFLDIGLPGLNGYEVATRIRAEETARGDEPAVLVALTGWGSEEDKRRSKEAGFDLHLTKPVDALRVEEILRAVPSLQPVTSTEVPPDRTRVAFP